MSKGRKLVNQDDKSILYTDGACPGNGTSQATGGLGLFFRWSLLNPDLKDQIMSLSYSEAQHALFLGQEAKKDSRWEDNVTNQRCEILAIGLCLREVHDLFMKSMDPEGEVPEDPELAKRVQLVGNFQGTLTLTTDSDWSIRCLDTWLSIWKRKKQIGSDYIGNKGPVVNQDVIKITEQFRDNLAKLGIRIQLKHCKGHSGNFGNEICDLLGNYACQKITEDKLKEGIRDWKMGLIMWNRAQEAKASDTGPVQKKTKLNETI